MTYTPINRAIEKAKIHEYPHSFASFNALMNFQHTEKIEDKDVSFYTTVTELNDHSPSFLTHLKELLKTKYHMPNILSYQEESKICEGLLLDDYMPYIYCMDREMYSCHIRQRFNVLNKVCTKGYTLSRFFEVKYGLRRVPLLDQISLLGYHAKDIKKALNDISRKNLTIHLLGYGGFGVNFVENLIELMTILNVKTLFRKLYIWEKDSLELHNILRFGTSSLLSTQQSIRDIEYYNLNAGVVSDPVHKFSLLYNNQIARLSKTKVELRRYFFQNNNAREYLITKDILVGTPDMATRQMLQEYDIPFFCPTHINDTIGLYYRPVVDQNLQYETYGKIALTPFFFNMLDNTIQILFNLAKFEGTLEQDTQLYTNTFKEFRGKASRKYTYYHLGENNDTIS